jgi:hypothetical protein
MILARMIGQNDMRLPFVCFAMLGLFAWSAALSAASTAPSELPAPEGLNRCAPSDPAALAVSDMAAKLGGEFLGCFLSDKKFTPPRASKVDPIPAENAFAIGLQGQSYTMTDVENLFLKVKDQWKNFDPLDPKFKDIYIAKLNEVLKNSKSLSSPDIISIKPILISIDRPADNYYLVTSIRTYSFDVQGEHIGLTKINSSAVVLRGSRLIRLTIQRTLSDPADVAQVHLEISKWARALVQG